MFKVMQDFGHQPYERLVIRSGDVWSFWSPWVHYNMAQETPFEVFAPLSDLRNLIDPLIIKRIKLHQ